MHYLWLIMYVGIDYPLNPVLSRTTVTSLSDVNPGDHLIIGSQHYLVDSTHVEANTFAAYTTHGGRVTREEEKTWNQNGGGGGGGASRIDYDQHSNSYHPGKALESARSEMEEESKWDFSDSFVSAMKCGQSHVITDKCLLTGDLEPIGCTCVNPRVAVDVGDHLVVRGTFKEYHSVLVYSCINEHTIVSMPGLNRKEPMGKLDLLRYNEIYRVNYPQSLPVEEILRRSCSKEGRQLLAEEGADPSCFVSWTKIGKQLSINIPKLIGKEKIAHLRPYEYEKIHSVDEIEVGDHLFVPNIAYRWHFLVTEKVLSGPHREVLFSTIYALRGTVKETLEKVDAIEDDVFRVVYPEEFPPSLAIKRARSLLGKVNLSPTARMWFVRWAKTGSDEGLEIDFLKRKSTPVSKSRVVCFSQLNAGDYLVEDKGRFYIRRHFIVTGVESACVCTVIGAWKGRVQETKLSLEESTYHRINYEEGVCLHSTEAIRRARDSITAQFRPKLLRRRFVNYIKTTDSVDIDVENLLEDRTLLKRERVESARDLAPGDHLEIPTTKSLQRTTSYCNMIVTTPPVGDRKVMVLRVDPQGSKQKLLEEEFDLGGVDEVYRVSYLERVDAWEAIEWLRRRMEDANSSVS